MADLLGRVDAPDRRAGHGPRRRLRAAPAARAGAAPRWWSCCVKEAPEARSAAEALVAELRRSGHRVRLDDRTDTSFGRRSVDWELKGVPVRVEVGPRDLAEGNVTVVTRHTREKQAVALGAVHDEGQRRAGAAPAPPCWPRRRRPGTPAPRGGHSRGGGRGRGGRASHGCRFGALGPEGEDRLAAPGVTVRCLQRPDGSLASRATTRRTSWPSSPGPTRPGPRAFPGGLRRGGRADSGIAIILRQSSS